MKNVITRPIVCRACHYKQTIEEIGGAYQPLTCKCGEVLFYHSRKLKRDKPKHGAVADGTKVIIFASEECYQEQKSLIPLRGRYGRKNESKRNKWDF
ncbi:hypothetical protein ES702_04983 [subsurface metagenome]